MSDPIHGGNSAVPRQAHQESRDRPARESAEIDEAVAEFSALLETEKKKVFPGGKGQSGGSPHEFGEDQAADRDGAEGESGDLAGASEMAENRSLPSPGDAILQGFSQSSASRTPAAESSATGTLEGIVQQVADQILVSDPASGTTEVRIMLKDSILPGTEVRISQEAGQLQVQLVTSSARSHEVLTENQSALQTRLTERLAHHNVVVEVAFDSKQSGDHQGRSRQQRDLREELEELDRGAGLPDV